MVHQFWIPKLFMYVVKLYGHKNSNMSSEETRPNFGLMPQSQVAQNGQTFQTSIRNVSK